MRNPCSICGTDCSGPGKFEGNECQVVARELYDVLGEGGGDDECGLGCCALIIGATAPDESSAYITHEDSQGFFGYQSYESIPAARVAWEADLASCDVPEEDN